MLEAWCNNIKKVNFVCQQSTKAAPSSEYFHYLLIYLSNVQEVAYSAYFLQPTVQNQTKDIRFDYVKKPENKKSSECSFVWKNVY